MNMKTIIKLYIIFTFSSQLTGAQVNSFVQGVTDRLYHHTSYTSQEKIYIHQDRTNYVAGETVWFKIYQSSTRDKIKSGIVYVELVNGNNEIVVETKWELKNASGYGCIELSDTLPRGVYQLRGYTNWMQNWYPEGFFDREIFISSSHGEDLEVEADFELIANKLNASLYFASVPKERIVYQLLLNGKASRAYPLEPDTEGEVFLEIELGQKELKEESIFFIIKAGEKEIKIPVSFLPPIQLSFFPEGGNLVANIPSKVAFKATNKAGKGINAKGIIVDETGTLIRHFEATDRGYGYFFLKPEPGRKYFAILNGTVNKIELPQIFPSGMVMSAKQWGESFRITLQANVLRDEILNPLYITIHQEGISWFNAQIEEKEDMMVLDIPIEKLPTGIFTITIYDENYHAWCERLAFVNYPEQLPLRLTTDRQYYGKRKKVTLWLDADHIGLENGDFSLAVIKSGLDDLQNRNNFYSDYFLRSELKGQIENPASYFTHKDSTGWNHLDLLLLTHGWRRYEWKNLMQTDYPNLRFPVENSLSFSGKVHLLNKKQKMENVNLTATFKHDSIDEAISLHPGSEGLFKFTGYHFYDTAEVILSAMDKNKNILDISIVEHLSFPANYYNYGRRMSKSDNDSLFIELSGSIIQNDAKNIDKKIFNLPEISITAKSREKKKNYNRLHNEEFARGIYKTNPNFSYGGSTANILYFIPGVMVRNPDLTDLRVSGSFSSPAYFFPVMFILNGMKSNRESILSLPPHLIEQVEVLSGAAAMIYGSDAVWGGAIVFYTKAPGISNQPTQTIVHKFPGYNQSKEFYSPDYSVSSKEYVDPDYRNTLYWQPEIITRNGGKVEINFYTSDEKGIYTIHCEGRSSEGIIGIAHQTFTVE